MADMEAAMAADTTLTDDLGTRGSKLGSMHHSLMASVADDEELTVLVDPVKLKAGGSKEVSTVVKLSKRAVLKAVERIRRAQQVSLVFVVDTTGSMASHIAAVKESIITIAKDVADSGCVIAGLAFVGYKDWCDGDDHFEVLPFTTDLSRFRDHVGHVTATGGGDAPEDVLGGLHKAIHLAWPVSSDSRILFHIGDAPPHGEQFYTGGDDFPKGHPKDPSLPTLFQQLKSKTIQYYFGRITSLTDKMLTVFEKHLDVPATRFDLTAGDDLASKVAVAATASIMETVGTVSAMTEAKKPPRARPYTIVKSEPDFDALPGQYCTLLTFKLQSCEDIVAFQMFEQDVKRATLKVAPHPFDKGAERLAYYARRVFGGVPPVKDKASSRTSDGSDESDCGFEDVIVKEFIRLPSKPELDRSRYMVSLETQTVASSLAFKFNSKLSRAGGAPYKVKFLMAKVACFPSTTSRTSGADSGNKRFMMLEKRFRGDVKMIKYTNNDRFVAKKPSDGEETEEHQKRLEVAVAFSHFTYTETDGYLLVCDLQGIKTQSAKKHDTILLTDPAIHCAKHKRFGSTNMGQHGFDAFFAAHKCNSYCRALGLVPP